MELIITAVLAFASTNIDDIFILMLFFASKRYQTSTVIIGQFLGIGALIAISFIGSFANLLLDRSYIGLLGLFPVFLGIKALIDSIKGKKTAAGSINERATGKGAAWSVAAVTVANGGDNIGIYIPLLAGISMRERIGMIIIFLVMTALWCLVGKYLSGHPLVARTVDKYGHMLTPVALILLGVYILYESGTFDLIK
jgi:cadmium resistance transport/sequestration family protein